MKISVIVPNYNKQDYIAQCLQSIKDQTFEDLECIVVDDGSTDNSKQVIDDFCKNDSRFKVFYNQNHGLAYSRNFAIHHANGQFILPVDADDFIDLTYIERAMTFFDKHPDYTLYYGKWQFIGYNADKMNAKFGNLHYIDYQKLLKSNSIHCSCIYKKDDALKCGLYDETMKAYEDWEFLIRLLHNGKKVKYDNQVSLFYRQFEQSMTSYGHQHYEEIQNYIRTKNKQIYEDNVYSENLSFRFVIPCCNSEKYIQQCIDSILVQDYQNFKIIVVDDMSTDKSVDVVKQMIEKRNDDKIQLHIATKKSYAGGCRNIGMQFEKDADYTWFVDSDDYLASKTVLSKIANALSAKKLPDIFAFQYLLDFNGKLCLSKSYDIVKAFQIGASLTNCTCAPWAKVYKTSFCIPFEENMFFGEDAIQTLMTLDAHPTILQSMLFRPYVYRQAQTSITNSLEHDKAKKIKEISLFNNRLKMLMSKCKDLHTKLCIVNKLKLEIEKIV